MTEQTDGPSGMPYTTDESQRWRRRALPRGGHKERICHECVKLNTALAQLQIYKRGLLSDTDIYTQHLVIKMLIPGRCNHDKMTDKLVDNVQSIIIHSVTNIIKSIIEQQRKHNRQERTLLKKLLKYLNPKTRDKIQTVTTELDRELCDKTWDSYLASKTTKLVEDIWRQQEAMTIDNYDGRNQQLKLRWPQDHQNTMDFMHSFKEEKITSPYCSAHITIY